MELATVITFVVYLIGMLAVGLAAYRLTSNLSDYVLGDVDSEVVWLL
ncbi:hypothetical protein BkAM31D_02085 [Halalkalibacter krulwichiae]|uniref:Uncharacterized protein n=1 Tax=Halalkalibacter krulwichiae TaxID=199441 RepID=A0A1X9M803_9BACI|nr:hypothetical protein BkAM31D_02085 [Halalkalibacter krulwichiae]